jgi:hypothetical protein
MNTSGKKEKGMVSIMSASEEDTSDGQKAKERT